MEKNCRLLAVLLVGFVLAWVVGAKPAHGETYQYTIEAGEYVIEDLASGEQQIKMEGFGQLLKAGKPKLPSKVFAIAIPSGAQVVSVELTGLDAVELPGTYNIVPVQAPLPGDNNAEGMRRAQEMYEKSYQATYGKDDPYPAGPGKSLGQGGYRNYNLVQVRFSPFEYRPQSGKLVMYQRGLVTIEYVSAAGPLAGGSVVEGIPEVEAAAQELLINYDQAEQWYQQAPAAGGDGEPSGGATTTVYDYVIITTEALEDSVWPIANWETCKGRLVAIRTTEWINTTYSGRDLAEKIRNFLRLTYGSWGIVKVLLVGDIGEVPMRSCYTPNWNGTWGYYPTDYYYAELSYDDDDSWDDDNDGRYGEEGQDSVDFLKEVDVGRIPWSDPCTVEHICMKMAEYEYSTDMSYKRNVLLPKAFWDGETEPTVTDNAVLGDMMLNNFFNGAGWSKWRLYEDYNNNTTHVYDDTLTHTHMVDYWSSNHYGYVCWSGHGSATTVAYNDGYGHISFIYSTDCTSLNDNYPSLIYSNSCSTANPQYANNLGRQTLKQGGVGFVGSTRVMGYMPGWDELSDGWGNTLAYRFSYYVHSGGIPVGLSHQQALRDMYTTYSWNDEWSSMFEYVLYGNPDMRIKDRPTSLPNLTEKTPTGWADPFVPRSAAGATDTWCPLTSTLPGNTNDTYYNWCWMNDGTENAPLHRLYLYVDGSQIGYQGMTLAAGADHKHMNWYYGPTVKGGRHTLWFEIDPDEQVWETNDGDNCWGEQYVWSPYGLTDDTPVTRTAPPDADAWGCSATSWFNNDGFSFGVDNVGEDKYWSAVGILPASSSCDYDLRLWNIGDYDYTDCKAGFGGGYLEYVTGGTGYSRYIVVNDNIAQDGEYYAGVINNNDATGYFHIEEATSVVISKRPGTQWNGAYAMPSTGVLDVYEVFLEAGDYTFYLDQTAGTCDLGMSLFDDETPDDPCVPGHYKNSDCLIAAESYGDGGDEQFDVSIADAGWHGLVVWKVDSSDYSKTSTYYIGVEPAGTACYIEGQPRGVCGETITATNVAAWNTLNAADQPIWCCDYQPCGDANNDGYVNPEDYLVIFANLGAHAVDIPRADVNHDGYVNPEDYLTIFSNLGQGDGEACP